MPELAEELFWTVVGIGGGIAVAGLLITAAYRLAWHLFGVDWFRGW